MKKYTIYSLFIALFAFVAQGCSLDENPEDKLTDNEAFKNPTLIYLNTVANIYSEVGADGGWGNGLGGNDRNIYDMNTMSADEAITPKRGSDWYDGGLWLGLYEHEWTRSTGIFNDTWEYLYRVIGKCNLSYEKLAEIQKKEPNNEYIPNFMAEVEALRAMYYYYLLDNYARVPIVTSSTIPMDKVVQSKRSEVYKFVVDELQKAIPFLSSEKSAAPGEYYGRMTKSVAYFLLAKLALNTQVYTDDNWAEHSAPAGTTNFTIDGKTMTCWEATIKYADLIEAEGYDLNKNFRDNFSPKNDQNPIENIFVIPMNPTIYKARNMYIVRSWNYNHAKAWGFSAWNGLSATKDVLRIFEYNKSTQDPRFEMSFFAGKVKGPKGEYVKDGDKDLEYLAEKIDLDLSAKPEEKTAGARWAKYEMDPNFLDDGKGINNDYVLFRFADVLLMKAEAMVRNGQNGDAVMKRVRDRVGAPARSATLGNILDERMMELSWENVRRQDLVRFGKYIEPNMLRKKKSEPYRIVFPIPETALNKNKNLTTNPGY